MAKIESSETEISGNSGSEEEIRNPKNGATDYEKQRLSRIAENKARMEALGLRTMASSLIKWAEKNEGGERKGKRKSKRGNVGEDEEYRPNEEEDGDEEDDDDELDSSSDDFEDEEGVNGGKSRSNSRKMKNKKSGSKKKVSVRKLLDTSDLMDEDEALMQAIALSLKDSGEVSNSTNTKDVNVGDRNAYDSLQEDTGKKRRKKSSNSRVQMTEDELVIHFCQFDEIGKGSITLRDLHRMAAAYDFTWTDKELSDMIRCFDSDGDGKLSLEDFRGVVERCNLLRGSEDAR